MSSTKPNRCKRRIKPRYLKRSSLYRLGKLLGLGCLLLLFRLPHKRLNNTQSEGDDDIYCVNLEIIVKNNHMETAIGSM